MAGITDGVPEVGVGEPLRLGDDGDFEVEHDPVTDRLVVRDTANGTEAYVRPDTSGQLAGQGAFLRSLANGEPLADDGHTYATVQEAERAANGWVFVPPGTFNENVTVNTEGLWVQGVGYNTLIDGGTSGEAFLVDAENVTVQNLCVQTTGGGGTDFAALKGTQDAVGLVVRSLTARDSDYEAITLVGAKGTIANCTVEACDETAISPDGENTIVTGCYVQSGAKSHGIDFNGAPNGIISNNIIAGVDGNGIGSPSSASDTIIGGNRIHNVGENGVYIGATDCIVFNNRVSGSANKNIYDSGTNTLLDSNVTGSAN